MDIDIADNGAFGSALVKLAPGEQFVSEAGSMFRASSNVDIDVTTRSRSAGGIMSGIRRMIAGEHFFFSRYSVTDGPGRGGWPGAQAPGTGRPRAV